MNRHIKPGIYEGPTSCRKAAMRMLSSSRWCGCVGTTSTKGPLCNSTTSAAPEETLKARIIYAKTRKPEPPHATFLSVYCSDGVVRQRTGNGPAPAHGPRSMGLVSTGRSGMAALI